MCRMQKAKYNEPVECAEISDVLVTDWHLSGMREREESVQRSRTLSRNKTCLGDVFVRNAVGLHIF